MNLECIGVQRPLGERIAMAKQEAPKQALAKTGSAEIGKPTASGAVAKLVSTEVTTSDAAKELADQLGINLRMETFDNADDYESVRGNDGLYRPEECAMGVDGKGNTIYCPIWGYPVGSVARRDLVNGTDYTQVRIQLTERCIALKSEGKGKDKSYARIFKEKGECIMVTVTYAIEELAYLAADPKQSWEVHVWPIGKLKLDNGREMWDYRFRKVRKPIPKIQVEMPEDFPPANAGALPQGATAG